MLRATSTIEAEDAATSHRMRGESRFAIRRILVVCLGNICRSPIAEYVLRKRLANRDVVVESAGLGAVDGAPIEPHALAVLAAHGIDARGHRARLLDKEMIDRADLVLVMETAQLRYLRWQIPSAAGKTFLLGKWQDGAELIDPFGQSRDAFEDVYRTVELAAERWCELI